MHLDRILHQSQNALVSSSAGNWYGSDADKEYKCINATFINDTLQSPIGALRVTATITLGEAESEQLQVQVIPRPYPGQQFDMLGSLITNKAARQGVEDQVLEIEGLLESAGCKPAGGLRTYIDYNQPHHAFFGIRLNIPNEASQVWPDAFNSRRNNMEIGSLFSVAERLYDAKLIGPDTQEMLWQLGGKLADGHLVEKGDHEQVEILRDLSTSKSKRAISGKQ